MCLSQVDNVNNLQRTKWSGGGLHREIHYEISSKLRPAAQNFGWCGKGMKLKCCLPSEVLTKPHKTSNLTQGKSPRMRCGGNLSGGENKQKTTKPCDGNNQWTMMMLAVRCDGLGGMGLGNNQ